MRLLLFALVFGLALASAIRLAQARWAVEQPTPAQVARPIALISAGVFVAILATGWFGLELDSGLLAAMGVFFGVMAWTRPAKNPDDPTQSVAMSLAGRLAMGAACVGLIFFAIRRTAGLTEAIATCRSQYALAVNPSDTATVDSLVAPGSPVPVSRFGRTMTCGRYRDRQFDP